MLTRRDALRAALLAVVIAPMTSACGGNDARPTDGRLDLVASDLDRVNGDPAAVPEVVTTLQAFAGKLYDRVAVEAGNVVLSPYSVAVALGMTLAGAGGTTAEEMRAVLGVDEDARFNAGLNALSADLDGLAGTIELVDGTEVELALAGANQLYGQADVSWQSDFLDLLARDYGAGLHAVDFENAHEQARVSINAWVAERTRDRIPDLIPSGVLDAATRLVLVNALYFKAPWETPFEESQTETLPFTRSDGTTVEAETMHRSSLSAVRTKGDGWQAARLPYAGQTLAMTVVLPDPGRLDTVESLLASPRGMADVLTGGRRTTLNLRLPKWTFRTQAQLNNALSELGMPTAFSDGADFTPMTDEDLDLFISDVLHEGFIAVDEKGTEAAAATAVVIRERSATTSESFHVDRAFVFVIHETEHGTPLFVGRVNDPTA